MVTFATARKMSLDDVCFSIESIERACFKNPMDGGDHWHILACAYTHTRFTARERVVNDAWREYANDYYCANLVLSVRSLWAINNALVCC